MKHFVKTLYFIFSMLFIYYLLIPNIGFPHNPSNALQSNEPADTESSERVAYFTNFDREEVVNYYLNIFKLGVFDVMPFVTLRLNYPPEEAQTIIRDQTRSSYLEEVTHPFRESIFINGFVPKEEKDNIFIGGRNWYQKVTVKHVESHIFIRTLIGLFSLTLISLVYRLYQATFRELKLSVFSLIKKSK